MQTLLGGGYPMTERNASYGYSVLRPQACISFVFHTESKADRFKRVATRIAINTLIALVIAACVIAACIFVSVVIPQIAPLFGFAIGSIGALAFLELKRT
jgi:hypothetical protein